MSECWWMAYAADEAKADVEQAVRGLEPEAKLVFAKDASALRSSLAAGNPGGFAVAIGPGCEGVSDINLAAAIVRDGRARKVMLVGRRLSGSLRSRAARAGVDEVVDVEAAAAAAPQLREVPISVESACAGPAEDISVSACGEGHPGAGPAQAEEGSAAPIIVVSSGRGGVGKTATTALSALVAAAWGMRVALVDLDLACGNLFTLFGLAHPPALDASLRRQPDQGLARSATLAGVGELLSCGQEVASGVMLWGPCERPELAEKVSPLVDDLLLHLASDFDLVLCDTSSTVTDATAQALQRCDRLLLLHDEDLSAVGSLSRSAALAVRLGVARTQIVRIANWGDRRVRFDLSFGRGELGLETARAFRLLDGGPEVGSALAAGKAAELAARGAEPVESLEQALARILDELGRLPDSEAARDALARSHGAAGRKFQLFGRKAS